MEKCKYPGCPHTATKAWAMVPMCDGHHDAIKWETAKYYRGRIDYWDRDNYHAISDMVPWRAEKEVAQRAICWD